MQSQQKVSPVLAAKAGNNVQYVMTKRADPVYVALSRWNNQLVLANTTQTGAEDPVQDDRAYTAQGAPQPFCRPNVRVAWRTGFQPGPEVRFEQRDDGMHLLVAFDEDQARRVPGAMPFDVKVKSVKLTYGINVEDTLDFPDPLQEPMDPQKGPAFRIEVDAVVPLDERRARIVAALQTPNAAKWVITMEFNWVRVIPPPPQPQPVPGPVVVGPIVRPGRPRPGRPEVEPFRPKPHFWRDEMMGRHVTRGVGADAAAVGNASAPVVARQEFLHTVLLMPLAFMPPQPTTEVKTYTIVRQLIAEYPKDSQENRPIFAAVTGDYVQIGWKNTAHGWFQPTPIQDTVYTLPDAYCLQVDEVTGMPSIQAVLLRRSDTGELIDTLDPKNYKVRLTLKAYPDFDTERLNALRVLIRAQSSDQLKYANLVLGGYASARFVPDPALAGLGELFAGSTAGALDTIDPAKGFTLTYEGNAEFIDLLFERLKGEGIGGSVELDLQEPGGTVRKQLVSVVLTLRKLAPLSLPWTFVEPPQPDPGTTPDPMDLLPHDLTLSNPTGLDVKIKGLSAYALQKSPVTDRVNEWFPAKADGTWPRVLSPKTSQVVHLTIEGQKLLLNAWDVALVDCHTETSGELVLSQLFDAATTGVRGWKIDIESPPMASFDQLSPEDQALMRDIRSIEVEVCRKGSDLIEEVRLTRQAPQGFVLLSRTVADFVSDRATGRSKFEYRQRILRNTSADKWSEWSEETGSALSIYLS